MQPSDSFHPVRWLKGRSYAKAYLDASGNPSRGWGGDDFMQRIFGHLQQMAGIVAQGYNHDIQRIPIDERPDPGTMLRTEMDIAATAAAFHRNGRNMFALSAGLMEALAVTDLGSVRVGDVLLPHQSFYISLEGLPVGGLAGSPNAIDGAYVSFTDDSLSITLTARRTDLEPSRPSGWILAPEPTFRLKIDRSEGRNPTFEEEIERAIASGDLRVAAPGARLAPDMERLLEDGAGFEDILPGRQFVSVAERNDLIEAINNRDGLPNAKRALSVVVNALAWLTAEPGDSMAHTVWPDDAPADLMELRRSTGKGARRRANAILAANGYSSIRILGTTVPSAREQLAQLGAGGELRNAHWRRGHWRRQAHGEGLSERKLLWIRPVLVRPDLEQAEGHVYRIGPR